LPPGQTSGIRIGTPAITTRGIKEPQIDILADLIDRAIISRSQPDKLKEIKKEVIKMTRKFPLYPELKGDIC
jgi:glycine hydroxymethyltransferase